MGRLTERDGNQWSFIACRDCYKPHCTDCEHFREQAARLAAYENSDLEAETARRIETENHRHYWITEAAKESADRDRWKARAEALEKAAKEECVCSICVYGGCAPSKTPCTSCEPDSSNWKFDEARFAQTKDGAQ